VLRYKPPRKPFNWRHFGRYWYRRQQVAGAEFTARRQWIFNKSTHNAFQTVLAFWRLFSLFDTERTRMGGNSRSAMCSNGKASIGPNAVCPAVVPHFCVTQLRPGAPARGVGVIVRAAPRPGERSARVGGLTGTEGLSLVLLPGPGG
jgi:hypothetical protein